MNSATRRPTHRGVSACTPSSLMVVSLRRGVALSLAILLQVIAGSLREFASEVRKANDETFQNLLACGIDKRDAIFLIHLDVSSPEEIVSKVGIVLVLVLVITDLERGGQLGSDPRVGWTCRPRSPSLSLTRFISLCLSLVRYQGKDELVKLLHAAYSVEGREPDIARLQAKAAKIIKAAEKALEPPSQQTTTIVAGEGGSHGSLRARSPGQQQTQSVAGIATAGGVGGRVNGGVSQEAQGGADAGVANAADAHPDAYPDATAKPAHPPAHQRIFDAIASGELMAIYMHASNLVDKKGRRSAETEMPKGLKPKPPEKIPIGIGFSWRSADEYVPLKGQSDAEAFVSRLKDALSRRATDAHIAMIGWHNQLGILEDLVGLELSQVMNVKLGAWILEPDRYETHVTNKFKKPNSSFGGKKRNRGEPKANQLKIRQTYQTASFETEAHEYCREILKLLDAEGTVDHYPDMVVVDDEGENAMDSIYTKITRKALRCMRSMLPTLRRTGLLRPLMETEMPICRIVGQIEERGCGFHQSWLHKVRRVVVGRGGGERGAQQRPVLHPTFPPHVLPPPASRISHSSPHVVVLQEHKHLLDVANQVSKRAAVVLQADTGESLAVDLAATSQLSTILYQRPYYALSPPEINKIRHKYHSTSKDALLELRLKHPTNRFIPLIGLYRSLQDLSSSMTTLGRFRDGDGKVGDERPDEHPDERPHAPTRSPSLTRSLPSLPWPSPASLARYERTFCRRALAPVALRPTSPTSSASRSARSSSSTTSWWTLRCASASSLRPRGG